MKKLAILGLLLGSLNLVAGTMADVQDKIIIQNVSFEKARWETCIKYLCMDSKRLNKEDKGFLNIVSFLPYDKKNPRINLKAENISVKKALEEILKQAKINYVLAPEAVLIGEKINPDLNFAKLKPFNKIIIDHMEFEDVPLSVFFKFLNFQGLDLGKGKKLKLIYHPPKEAKKKAIPSEEEEEIEDFLLDDGKTRKPEKKKEVSFEDYSLNVVVDNIPLDSLISYICRIANLEYKVGENTVTIRHKKK